MEESMTHTVFSGIRPTGMLHIGNYLGAIKGMLELQEKYHCIFAVVDYHAITTPYDPKKMQEHIRNAAMDYLAAGLDPKKSLFIVQSHVPEHIELSYLLSTLYPVSRLTQLPTYKEKKAQHPKYVHMGLLYYPILMAADILLYKVDLVPVGIDQEPHLEVAREIARAFNKRFGDTFPEPIRYKTEGEYVPSLLGEGKMSKTVEGSYIALTDSPSMIRQKVMAAVTDSGPIKKHQAMSQPIENLFTFLRLFSSKEVVLRFETQYDEATIRYADLKKQIAEDIIRVLTPFQKKRKYYTEHPDLVEEVLHEGAQKARHIAQKTIQEVKQKMGLL